MVLLAFNTCFTFVMMFGYTTLMLRVRSTWRACDDILDKVIVIISLAAATAVVILWLLAMVQYIHTFK